MKVYSNGEDAVVVVEMEESDYQGRCERCGRAVDIRNAYKRMVAYYCNQCRLTLLEEEQ